MGWRFRTKIKIILPSLSGNARYKANHMKRYLSEKNALTVVVSIFCFIMMIISIVSKQSIWEAIAFALAFSFSVEIICHRTKEKS
jgi:hypothetical protein